MDKRGIALFMVFGTILVVVILANVILNIMLSHSRLSHHQVGRIQAYYAAMAGTNYALEMLRTGTWTPPAVKSMCRAGCDVNDPNLPPYTVTITIGATGSAAGTSPAIPGTAPVSATVAYTSQ